jgi:hypothetical protein
MGRNVKALKVNKERVQKIAPKFRGPDGETWVGSGIHPYEKGAMVLFDPNQGTFSRS